MEETIDNNSGGVEITPKMRADLKGAAPWMKFVGIFYIIIGGLGALIPLILMTQVFDISLVVMLAMFALFIYLATLVLKMGTQYSVFLDNLNSASLERAFAAQKKFWMITGILIILGILTGIISYGYMQEFMENNPT